MQLSIAYLVGWCCNFWVQNKRRVMTESAEDIVIETEKKEKSTEGKGIVTQDVITEFLSASTRITDRKLDGKKLYSMEASYQIVFY